MYGSLKSWFLPFLFEGWFACRFPFNVEYNKSRRIYEVVVERDGLKHRIDLEETGPDLLVPPEKAEALTRFMQIGSGVRLAPLDPVIGQILEMVQAHHDSRYDCTPKGLSYLRQGEQVVSDILNYWMQIDGFNSPDGIGPRVASYFALVDPVTIAMNPGNDGWDLTVGEWKDLRRG